MSADCTPLKLKYDSCFNAWLETYLSPELTSALSRDSRSGGHSSSSNSSLEDNNSNAKAQRTRKMAQEYESKCGEAWKAYNNCVTVCLFLFLPLYSFVVQQFCGFAVLSTNWRTFVIPVSRKPSKSTSWKISSIKHEKRTLSEISKVILTRLIPLDLCRNTMVTWLRSFPLSYHPSTFTSQEVMYHFIVVYENHNSGLECELY